MFTYENKLFNDIPYSRFIASWINKGGKITYIGAFRDWLYSLGMDEKQANEVINLARNGKLELEESAKLFMKNYVNTHDMMDELD